MSIGHSTEVPTAESTMNRRWATWASGEASGWVGGKGTLQMASFLVRSIMKNHKIIETR